MWTSLEASWALFGSTAGTGGALEDKLNAASGGTLGLWDSGILGFWNSGRRGETVRLREWETLVELGRHEMQALEINIYSFLATKSSLSFVGGRTSQAQLGQGQYCRAQRRHY